MEAKIIIFSVIFLLKITPYLFEEREFESAQIVLFYSPLGESRAIRGQIVIYWFVEEFVKGDFLALYYNSEDELLFTYQPAEMSGYVKTGVSPSKEYYSMDSTYVEQCTGYIGAWFRNDTLRKSSCLSTHPDWMNKHQDILMNMTLRELFIPGTHSSGSYSEELPPTIIQRYTITQEKSILDQLISGIRYLDLRPCIIDDEYWNCHGEYGIQPFGKIIDDILEFIINTNEIIIVGFKEFPRGFYTNKNYDDFLIYITKNLGSHHIFPYPISKNITLGDVWQEGKRIIISYLGEYNGERDLLWTKVHHQWGNVQNAAQLEGFITSSENDAKISTLRDIQYASLRAMMAVITLDSSMIIVDAALHYFGRGRKSLRELAVEIGPLITMWFNEEHFRTANIVAVDFSDTTGLVEIAIRSNINRGSKNL
ncbi:PI-PLC X domain-containing protein 1-like [Cotesia glomerata]|uniref:PI-PLC X domain-containing protein 1-like n=1 Tax=Cotesia glomerata TaxID=32391 RepID=UPI001D030841|nr:PI-PLC X domain-containing protein 1-like [Cotesia glomerata]